MNAEEAADPPQAVDVQVSDGGGGLIEDVRDHVGDPGHVERKGFFHKHSQGKKVMVKFADGEVIFGHTLSYSRRGLGFFMFPGDPDCNNTKVFVVHAATDQVKVMDAPSALSANNYTR